MAMAEVAYADSEVKKKAEEDAQAIVDCIMSGRLDAALANAANARHEAHEEEEARAAGREEEKEGGGGDGGAIVVSSGGGGSNSGGERAGHLGAGQEDGGDHELIDILASFIAPPPLPGEEGADDTDDEEEGGGKDISGGGAADTKANSAFVATASTHTKKPRSDLDRAASGPPLASSPSSAFHKKQPLRHWDNSRSNELSNNDQLTSRSSHNSRSSFEGGSQRGSLGSGNAADHTSIRSDSLNRAIDEYPAAVRYLKEGVEFTKTTYLATYRYSLKLNLESRRLEWSRVGGGKSSTKHSLVLDQHLSFLDDHEVGKGKDAADGNTPTSRKVSVVGVGGAATFTFPAASSAQQFKGCLQVGTWGGKQTHNFLAAAAVRLVLPGMAMRVPLFFCQVKHTCAFLSSFDVFLLFFSAGGPKQAPQFPCQQWRRWRRKPGAQEPPSDKNKPDLKTHSRSFLAALILPLISVARTLGYWGSCLGCYRPTCALGFLCVAAAGY
jgi:hypothetical protein